MVSTFFCRHCQGAITDVVNSASDKVIEEEHKEKKTKISEAAAEQVPTKKKDKPVSPPTSTASGSMSEATHAAFASLAARVTQVETKQQEQTTSISNMASSLGAVEARSSERPPSCSKL